VLWTACSAWRAVQCLTACGAVVRAEWLCQPRPRSAFRSSQDDCLLHTFHHLDRHHTPYCLLIDPLPYLRAPMLQSWPVQRGSGVMRRH